MPELHPQFLIDPDGKPLSALLPIAEYEALIERLEDLQDIEAAREALARIEHGDEETDRLTTRASLSMGCPT